MKEPSESEGLAVIYVAAIMGTFLLMATIVWMVQREGLPAVDAARSEERRKAARELQLGADEQLRNYAILDQERGLVRIPVERAMELMVREGQQDPERARQMLAQRWRQLNPAAGSAAPAPAGQP